MKINWGTGIAIAIASFMIFILYFVIKVQTNSDYENELVFDDYYEKELLVSDNIVKYTNSSELKIPLKFHEVEEGILCVFPSNFDYKNIQGTVSLYRPSDQKLDFEVPVSLSSHHLLIPKSILADGRWDITIDWTHDSVAYLDKATLYVK